MADSADYRLLDHCVPRRFGRLLADPEASTAFDVVGRAMTGAL